MMRSIGAKDKTSTALLSSPKRLKPANGVIRFQAQHAAQDDSMNATQLQRLNAALSHQALNMPPSLQQLPCRDNEQVSQVLPVDESPPQMPLQPSLQMSEIGNTSALSQSGWPASNTHTMFVAQGALQPFQTTPLLGSVCGHSSWQYPSRPNVTRACIDLTRANSPNVISQLRHPLQLSLDSRHFNPMCHYNDTRSMADGFSNVAYNEGLLTPTRPYHELLRSVVAPAMVNTATLATHSQPVQVRTASLEAQPQNLMRSSAPVMDQGSAIPTHSLTTTRNNVGPNPVSGTPNPLGMTTTRCLSHPYDSMVLSKFQVYLRMHIEAFVATTDDVDCTVRGRSKKIRLHQVGLRCRHCAHVSPDKRMKGATYVPLSTLGFYQAAQNMSAVHLQCGACPEMPDAVKTVFAKLLGTKTPGSGSRAGRKYWSQQALQLGMINTDVGVFPFHLVPVDACIILSPV